MRDSITEVDLLRESKGYKDYLAAIDLIAQDELVTIEYTEDPVIHFHPFRYVDIECGLFPPSSPVEKPVIRQFAHSENDYTLNLLKQ